MRNTPAPTASAVKVLTAWRGVRNLVRIVRVAIAPADPAGNHDV